MLRFRLWLFLVPICVVFIFLGLGQAEEVFAQPLITNTPLSVTIPDITPTEANLSGSFIEASPSPTFTPTVPPPDVYAEADPAISISDTLVRDFPENGTVLGTLLTGEQYPVFGQYFSWILIEYATAPNQRAWVYFETVRLFGDIGSIPFVDQNAAAPQQRSPEQDATETAQVLFQTLGFAETATAASRVIIIEQETISAAPTEGVRPTYTPPADIVQRLPTLDANAFPTATPQTSELVGTAIETVFAGAVAPIVPIAALFIFGILGLAISLIRR